MVDKKRTFSKKTQDQIKRIVARYPKEQKQSAVIPVLWLAQNEFGGWLDTASMELVAETLDMPYIRVYEVATFYTMFNKEPVGKYHLQVCTNCACMVRGSDKILQSITEELGITPGQTTKDGRFTLTEVECLGACVDAPMMQINTHYYTNLTGAKTKGIIQDLGKGRVPTADTPPADVDPIHHDAYVEINTEGKGDAN